MSRAFAASIILVGGALSGCTTMAPSQTDGAPVTATYMALGTEPFWNLEITPTQLNFNRPDAPRISVPHGGWRPSGAGRAITTRRIAVAQLPGPCSDGMSDRRYADSVRVTVDGREYRGCGGREMAHQGASLERSSWRITHINGQPALADPHADLAFADGRMSGTAGCNRLGGAFTQDRNRLTFGGIMATRMSCIGPRGDQENRVLAILQQPLTIRFGERMTMTWTAADGTSIGLRRLDWD